MEGIVAERPRTKPEGGFVPIKVWLLAAAWWCYQSGRVTPRALRVFLGLHEMQARRCELERGRTPHYSLDELQGLVGGVGGAHLRRDLTELKRLGLIRARDPHGGGGEAAFSWPTSIEDLGIPLREFHPWFKEHFQNRARLVPLPRRLIRFLAGSGTRALLATTLGHAIRMLYLRNNQVDPRGRCKASWVAAAFGVSLSSVERARARLLELGILRSGDDGSAKERWARRRWGGCFYWSLGWSDVPVCRDTDSQVSTGAPDEQVGGIQRKPETETVENSDTGLGGVSGFSTTGLGGVESDKHPLRGSKNQQPTSGRPGAAGVFKQDSVGGGGTKPPANAASPRLTHIEDADLTNPERLLELHSQAQKAGLIECSEADRLRFAALAEHAHSYGTTNRGGLFARLLGLWGTAPKWHFITQLDEDRATRRLKEHALREEPGWEPVPVAEPEPQQAASPRKPELSDDARFVQLLCRTLAKRGITTGVFSHLRRFRPEWTRERWDAACRELAPTSPVGEK